jgi:hypothetical protein
MPNLPMTRQWLKYLPWLIGLVAAGMAARNLIGGGGDLGIYLDTGHELHQEGVNLFRARPESAPIAYPPVAMLPFAWLQLVCSDTTIRWLWCLGMGLATAMLVRDLPRAMAPFGRLSCLQWVVFGVLFQRCIAQNLTHGQMSLWVSALMLRGTLHLQERREWRGGGLIGLAAALKLTPLLFVLVLPLLHKTRGAIMTALTFALLVYVVPIPFLGWDLHVHHLQDFHTAVIAPIFGGGKSELMALHPTSYSIAGTLEPLLQQRPIDATGTTVNLVDLSDSSYALVKLAWSAAIATLLAAWVWTARKLPTQQQIAHGAAAVMMGIAFFSPLTRAYHLAGALLPFAMFCRGPTSRRDVLWWSAAIAVAAAQTFRQRKLLGDTLWRLIDNLGVMHLGMVAITVWLLLLARRDAVSAPAA